IRQYINETPVDNIYFLKDLIGIDNATFVRSKTLNKFKKYDFLNLFDRINALRNILKWFRKVEPENIGNLDLNQFDVIHFHVSYHINNASKILKKYKGKIVLTTHSPEPLSHEALASYPRISLIKPILLRMLENAELRNWYKADFMMFPVEGAVEPYFVNSKMKYFLEHNKSKLKFCPTSIVQSRIERDKIWLCDLLSIPHDSIIISYVGRHNIVKGYDQLVELYKRIHKKYSNVYFVCAGNISEIDYPHDDNWIELGWIDYGPKLIASSDLFVLSNKETYFDIITLEVLRAGTPILMSKTGGNKHFLTYKKEERQGILFYEYGDIDKEVELVEVFINSDSLTIEKMRERNMELYNKYFTPKSYLE
ncbi:MAG: glycosyltransferase family 4 protein, partial [Allobaculum sp.]|nr:glycosyltransferase family 4 protein [Allobaculum sp.]